MRVCVSVQMMAVRLGRVKPTVKNNGAPIQTFRKPAAVKRAGRLVQPEWQS